MSVFKFKCVQSIIYYGPLWWLAGMFPSQSSVDLLVGPNCIVLLECVSIVFGVAGSVAIMVNAKR